MKRFLFILTVLLILPAILLNGCASQSDTVLETTEGTPNVSETAAGTPSVSEALAIETTAMANSEPLEISVFRGIDLTQAFDDTTFVNFVRDKFNLTLTYEYVPSSTSTEKLNLAFATNSYPDMIDIDSVSTINHLAADGFMIPFSDHMDKLTNYRKAFKDADWNVMVQSIVDANGKFYILPQKWAENSTGTFVWMYRVEEFNKAGLSLPKTADEFLNAMRTLKKINPNLTIPNRWGLWNAMEGFNLAFRVQYDIWFDPDANDVVYAPATDKYRDLIKFMSTLFKEGILSKEFVTMTPQQRTSEFTKGNVYANFQFAGAEVAINQWQSANELPQDWAYNNDYLLFSAYPDRKAMRQHWPMYMNMGVALTDTITSEELDRVLQYLDWSCTEEGQLFHEFGIEGTTYEMVDGHPQYLKDTKANDSYQDTLANYGPFSYYLVQNEWWASVQYPAQSIVNEVTKGIYDECDMNALPTLLTTEEETKIADIGTVLTQTRDEWTQAFVMGQKDPYDDVQWNTFIKNLKDSGLDEFVSIKKQANRRLQP